MFDPISYKKARDVEDKLSLKTSQIEKDLKDYQATLSNLNPNQEAKQSVSDYGIVSLPKNSANGQASVNLRGQTATNLIDNSDFTNGTTRWSGIGCSITVTDNILTTNSSGNSRFPRVTQILSAMKPLKVGDKLFVKAKIKPLSECDALFIRLADSDQQTIFKTVSFSGPVINAWQEISEIIEVTSEFADTDKFVVKVGQEIPAEEAGYQMQVKDVIAINITDLGSIDLTTCDKRFANWFDGTKNVQGACRVRGVGRNLIDGKEFANKAVAMANDPNSCYITQMDGRDVLAIRGSFFTENNINPTYNFKPDTRYTVQVECKRQFADQESPYLAILYTDGTRTNLRAVSNTWGKVVITSEAGKSVQGFIFVRLNDYFVYYDYNTLKIEEGSVATPYEPYTESALYLQGQELRGLPNGVRDEIRKSANGGYELVQRVAEDGTELLEPIITPIPSSGTLLSNPSGTVYIEPVLSVAGLYEDVGIPVTNSDYPIDTLERIYKIDFVTGIETELPASDAVVAENGLSFTHPELTKGDIVFFTYFYPAEYPHGELTVNYYDTRYTVKDSVTGKFYKWEISVANGTPSIDLVEV